jgi:phosphate starvation-inducible membrane PsiE
MVLILISVWQRLIKPSVLLNTLEIAGTEAFIKQKKPHYHSQNQVQYGQYVYAQVYPLLVIAESIWLSVIALSCAYIWLGEWAGLSAILVQVVLLFRAKLVHSSQASKTSLEVLAVILILFPLAYAAAGSVEVNSMHFSMLPGYAKASLVIALAQLWLWSAFYRKFNPQSTLREIAERVRILFYLLLPVCWLPASYRRFDEDILMLVWLSPVIAMLLAYFTKAKPLLLQSKVLFIGLTFSTLLLLVDTQLGISAIGLSGYLLVVALAYLLAKKATADLDIAAKTEINFGFVNNWAINTVGIMLAIIVEFRFNSFVLPL